MSCPVVSAPCGQVKGRVSNVPEVNDAKQSYAYLGIPFAKPPVEGLRFEPPQRIKTWEGILDATKQVGGPAQPFSLMGDLKDSFLIGNQYESPLDHFSEDCLYLNVFTSNPSNAANMPVMVWFYGGGFQGGAIDLYDPQVLCSLHDVVVVMPNYRVNALGFLTLGPNTKYKGNMGLKDQIMALEWARDNIREFGGNPENVTIFGESAGSVSVACHMVSPLSRGLFHRSIHHSGALNFPLLVKNDFPEVRNSFLKELGVTETEPLAIMKILKNLPVEKIIEAQDRGIKELNFWAVSIDQEVIPDGPTELLRRKSISTIPSIIGCNNTEGSGIISDNFPGYDDGLKEEFVREVIKAGLVGIVKEEKLEKAVQATVDFYSPTFDDSDKMKWSKILSAMVCDSWFVVPSVEQSNTHSEISEGNTYLYYMTHQMRLHHEDGFGKAKKKLDYCEADHTDDIMFTLGLPFYSGKTTFEAKFTESEKDLSRKWMTYLTNFAKSGNPNKGGKVDVEWPNYDLKTKQHLTFQNPFGTGENVCKEAVKFWMETLPSM